MSKVKSQKSNRSVGVGVPGVPLRSRVMFAGIARAITKKFKAPRARSNPSGTAKAEAIQVFLRVRPLVNAINETK